MTQLEASTTSPITGRWKSYPAYRDSRVEWLGEIPEHWKVRRLKYISYCLDGQRIPLNSEQRAAMQGNYPYWGANCVIDYVNRWLFNEELVLLGEDGAPFFVLNKEVAFFVSGKIWVNNHAHVLRPKKDMNARFLAYTLNMVDYRAFIDGSTRDKLTQNDMNIIPVQYPSYSEQCVIAAFLDCETTRINTLIAKKERLIELLQEKRAALISHAVTKGLDPALPMKDSDVEWLGEIPAHWEVKRLKFCLDSIEQGWSPTCENRPAEIDEWGVLKVGCVNGIEFRPDENKALPAETQPVSELEIKQGDILVSRANTRELLGSASVVKQVRPHLLLCDKLYRLKILPGTVNPIYLVLAMGSGIIRFQLERDATGASNSMQNISQSTVLNLVIPLPHLSEQQTIVAYLDHETAKIDALVSRVLDGIEKLREYRMAIISAAVTGKIDVRGETATLDDIRFQSAD